MREVADGVFCVTGTAVNWVVVRSGRDVTLIDGGYPRDVGAVEASIRSVGARPEDLRAVLLTHAHADHLGGPAVLHSRYGVPVLTGAREAAHARREFLEQVSPAQVVIRSWQPRWALWGVRIIAAGALSHASVPSAQDYDGLLGADGALDLPGGPVPIPCAGHTSGHTAYHLPGAGVLVSGDALVTGHELWGWAGPRLLPAPFAHDPEAAFDTLDALAATGAGVLVPGHGDPWEGDLRDAVTEARGHVRREERAGRTRRA